MREISSPPIIRHIDVIMESVKSGKNIKFWAFSLYIFDLYIKIIVGGKK